MKTIAAAAFKARCLSLLDEVQRKREPVLITKRGKPMARLLPPEIDENDIFDRLKGRFRIVGDIESPIEPPEAWDANR